MRLAELLPGANIPAGLAESDISEIVCDSRLATPGSAFFAVPGSARTASPSRRRPCGRAPSPSSPRRAGRRQSIKPPLVEVADVRAALAIASARLLSAPARNNRRHHRHQRQDLGRRLHAADLGGARASPPPRSARSASSRPADRTMAR